MPTKLTTSDIVQAIGKLPTNRAYNYIDVATTTKILIAQVARPLGPITLRRYDPHKGQGQASAKAAHISTNMISRVANAIRPDQPVNIDRILGASYNTRSALEALLAHTPEFYICRPGRIEVSASTTKIKPGHKHLVWCPGDPHEAGIVREKNTDVVISEMPSIDAVYEALALPTEITEAPGSNIEVARRHAQIQIALVLIGRQLGFRTWVARNDKGIIYNNKRLAETEGVVEELEDESLIAPHAGAIRAALLIDCIWFRNARFMPAVIEIEHTTGVTSGLTRMKNLQDALPPFQTRWVISAPDEEREKVITEANKPMFRPLKAQFFPYSAVDELYALCQRRNIGKNSVNEEFLDAFMEPCLQSSM
jgi:type II restriction enzyme